MKNNLTRVLSLCLALLMTVALCACGNTEKPAETSADTQPTTASETTAPTETTLAAETTAFAQTTYDLTGNEGLTVSGETFDGDVIITGEKGSIIFMDCVFKGSIFLNGGEDAKVMLLDNCTVSPVTVCTIDSTFTEATIETALPKFIAFCELPSFIVKKAGAVVVAATANVFVNGTEYTLAQSELFVDEEKGVMEDYNGQEAIYFNVGTWAENGQQVTKVTAIGTAE